MLKWKKKPKPEDRKGGYLLRNRLRKRYLLLPMLIDDEWRWLGRGVWWERRMNFSKRPYWRWVKENWEDDAEMIAHAENRRTTMPFQLVYSRPDPVTDPPTRRSRSAKSAVKGKITRES